MIIKKKQFLFPSTHFAQKFNISSDFLSSSLALVEHDREVFTSLVRNDRSESIVYAAVFASRATHTVDRRRGGRSRTALSPQGKRDYTRIRNAETSLHPFFPPPMYLLLDLFETFRIRSANVSEIVYDFWTAVKRGREGVEGCLLVNLLKKIFVFVRNFSTQDRLLKIVCY